MADINIPANKVWTYIPFNEYDPAKHGLPVAGEAIQASQRLVLDSSADPIRVLKERGSIPLALSRPCVGLAENNAQAGEPVKVITQKIGVALEGIPKGGMGRIQLEADGITLLLVIGK